MAKFKYFEPADLAEALSLLQNYGDAFYAARSPIKDLPLLPHEGLAYWQAADYDSKRVLMNLPMRRKDHARFEYLRSAPKGNQRSALSLLASGS